MMKSLGFTVLELLVAISVATILLTIGIPSFMKIIAENRRVSYTAEVYNTLNYARSEAIARNVSVVVCKSSNGTSCSSGGRWEDGWLVYANLSGAAESESVNGKPADADLPLFSNSGFKSYSMDSDEYPDRVFFLAAGRASVTGQFTLCPDSQNIDGRIVRINAAGRATTPEKAEAECNEGGE